jgi:pilus assembly protein CpaB
MNKKQVGILGVAGLAAVGAGYLALNLATPAPVVVERVEEAPKVELAQVLVATADLDVGSKIEGAVRWHPWPKEALIGGLITKDVSPDAVTELDQFIVRNKMYQNEPISRTKLLGPGERFLSSQLPKGKRAIAVQVSADTSAGGFVLPNDFVDLIMTRRDSTGAASGTEGYITETILENVRVLAIDQTVIESEDGSKTKVGDTATLELTPQQAEIVNVAQQMADRLTLSLRSIADVNEVVDEGANYLVGKGSVQVIKSGKISVVGGGQ